MGGQHALSGRAGGNRARLGGPRQVAERGRDRRGGRRGMGQDPASMERDIEETRAELAQTIDAIVDRVSPKRIAQRSIDQVKERMESRRSESVESGGRLALPAGSGGGHPAGRLRADDPLGSGGACRRGGRRAPAGAPAGAPPEGRCWLTARWLGCRRRRSRGSIRPPGAAARPPAAPSGRRAEEVDRGGAAADPPRGDRVEQERAAHRPNRPGVDRSRRGTSAQTRRRCWRNTSLCSCSPAR